MPPRPAPRRRAAALVLVAVATAPLSAQGALTDLPLPRTGTRAVQFASTDPSGGNIDHGHFRGPADAAGWRPLAAVQGSGRVTRFWSANAQGELRVTLDGDVLFAGPMAAFLGGQVAPFVGPLIGGHSGGGLVSYLPLPFRRSLHVAARGADLSPLYYQLGVQYGPEPQGFTPERLVADAAALLDRGVANERARRHRAPGLVATPAGTSAVRLDGAGEVVELRLTPAADWSRTLRRGVWLEARADGARVPQLEAPLGELFGVGFDGAGVETLPVHSAGRARVFRLPLPFHAGLELRLVSAGSAPVPVGELAYSWRELPADHPRGVLHARFQRRVNRAGEPFPILHLDAAAGHLVGALFTFAGAPAQGLTYLEGDEAIHVDGAAQPAVAGTGTGTEDDIGGAWYFRGGPFGHVYHAVATLDERRGRTTAARYRIADPLPFTSALRWTTEHGGGNDAPGSDYAALALWYQHRGAPPPATDWDVLRGQPAVFTLHRRDAHPLRSIVDRLDDPLELVLPGPAPSHVTALHAAPWLPTIRRWRLVGPFRPATPRQGIDEVFGPERDLAAERTYDVTGDDPRGWRAPPTPPGWTGYLDLNAPFDPRTEVVAYACTEVHSPTPQQATLVLGSDDAVKVFLDGREVHRHRLLRGAGRDQDRVPVRLRAGTQPLLIKVENYRGGFGLYARFEDARGLRTRSGLE